MKAIRRWLGLGVAAGLFVPGVWGAAPPNDDFAAATIVAGFPATATGSNVDATVEEGEPLLGDWYEYSVWYRWTAPTAGAVRIDTLEGGIDTILAVWTNAALTNLALVAQNDSYDETEMSAVFFDAVSGTTYQIAVYGYDYDLGDLALRITNDVLPRISGTVTGPGGAPALAGIEAQVRRWNEADEWWYWVNEATSDATGQYEVRGIPAGTYRIQFHDDLNGDYLDEVFDDAVDLDSGADVVVGAANVTGIDAELAVASKITGTVTGPDGETPLANIHVFAFVADEMWGGWGSVASVYTDESGIYTIGGLPAGTYRVEFSDWRNGVYLTEVYSNAVDVDSGLDVVVAATTTVTGINASLALASKISGTVTGPDGEPPLEGIQATAYGWNATGESWDHVRSATTDVAGGYEIGGLTAGTYRVEFQDGQNGNYLTEVYADAGDLVAGTDVEVAEGGTTGGIDASLALAGKISGTVTGPDGETPLPSILVRIYRWNVEWEYWESGSGSFTDETGFYTIGGLTAGTYRVEFEDVFSRVHASEAYSNALSVEFGQDIVVAVGETAAGIDASLALAARISGTVTGPDGETPLEGIRVSAYIWNGAGWGPGFSEVTGTDGTYTLSGLPAGTYRASFRDEDTEAYTSEVYSNAVDLASGQDIVVAAGETVAGIDAALVEASKISGRVTRMDGTTPLEGIYVETYQWNGEYWGYGDSTYTEMDGNYELGGLEAGTYRVRFSDPTATYLSEVYDNVLGWDWDEGADVVLAAGESAAGIDAALAEVSKISGRVTRMDGTTPLEGITVDAYGWNGADWEYGASTETDLDGNYELGGLDAGTYRVRFYDQTATYLSEIHEDVLWLWAWDGGRDVVLAAGESATGIDAALSLPSSTITGTVTSENGATPLVNLYVKAYRRAGAGWNFFTESYTDAAGFYELSGLGAGTYRVVFQDFSEGHFSEVYDNVPGLDCGAGGADIAVDEDETVAGIDAMLSVVGAAPALAGVRWTVEEGFVIQFLGTEDMRYMLQEASSLTGAWTDVGTTVSALAGTNALPRAAGASQMYWRVRQVP